MLKNICEGLDKGGNLQEALGGISLERDAMFNMFKTMMTTSEVDDERFGAIAAQFDKALMDVHQITIDDLMSALDQVEYDDDGNYIGGGEVAARYLNVPAAAVAKFLDSMGEDAETNVEKVITEMCKNTGKKPMRKRERMGQQGGQQEGQDTEVDLDTIMEKLGDEPSFEPIEEDDKK